MKFTLSWLKAPLDTDADAQTIADKLTSIGLEVESVEDAGARLAAFTVAHVISAEKHPNADKLKLCMVDVGTGAPASSSEAVGQKNIVQVVCGAPNAHTGMKAVFAKPGTVIPVSGAELKIGTIRGVESRGMLCSGRELLLNDDHDGIIELPANAVVGEPAAKALGLNDPVIDVSITPNRGDAASVYGIARDLAAAGLGRLREGDLSPVPGTFKSPIHPVLDFPAGKENATPMFAGRLIRGVKNGPSPQWLQDWLKAVGLRPISALVDVTNFLSLDRGRPLHVFDAAKLKGNLRVSFFQPPKTWDDMELTREDIKDFAAQGRELIPTGPENEYGLLPYKIATSQTVVFKALDGKEYPLDPQMIVIADLEKVVGIAGIMGGEETSCTDATTDVFIECALFDPVRIARTGRLLGILSDARYRFERGVDPEFVLPGIELATKMIMKFCGGEPSEVVVAGHVPNWTRNISFTPAAVKKLAGIDVPKDEIVRILGRLGFTIEGHDPMTVVPPSWRGDIVGSADLVEEVVRIYGLDKVTSAPLPRDSVMAKTAITPAQRRIRLAKRELASRGFHETINFTFIPRAHAKLFGGGDDARQLENPIAADLDALRPSVLPSLLAAAARNQARGFNEMMLAEVGAQFQSGMPEAQSNVAAGIRVGAGARAWTKSTHAADAFNAKADMLAILETAMNGPMTAPVKAGAAAWYHPGRSGTLALGPKMLAYFGELHPKIIAAFDLKGPVSAFEVFLDAIPESKSKGKARSLFAPSQFQPVERDFAFVVDASVTADAIIKATKAAERDLIERVDVFDVYEGKGVPEGKKSLAIDVRLQPKDKTLTDAEIEAIAQKIIAAVTKATGAVLRA